MKYFILAFMLFIVDTVFAATPGVQGCPDEKIEDYFALNSAKNDVRACVFIDWADEGFFVLVPSNGKKLRVKIFTKFNSANIKTYTPPTIEEGNFFISSDDENEIVFTFNLDFENRTDTYKIAYYKKSDSFALMEFFSKKDENILCELESPSKVELTYLTERMILRCMPFKN